MSGVALVFPEHAGVKGEQIETATFHFRRRRGRRRRTFDDISRATGPNARRSGVLPHGCRWGSDRRHCGLLWSVSCPGTVCPDAAAGTATLPHPPPATGALPSHGCRRQQPTWRRRPSPSGHRRRCRSHRALGVPGGRSYHRGGGELGFVGLVVVARSALAEVMWLVPIIPHAASLTATSSWPAPDTKESAAYLASDSAVRLPARQPDGPTSRRALEHSDREGWRLKRCQTHRTSRPL